MIRLLTPAVTLAAAIGLAAPTHADAADDHYLYLLQEAGAVNIDFPLARRQGIQSCVMLGEGSTMAETVDDLVRAGPYSAVEATAMTAAAIMAYCPWLGPRR